MKNTSLAVVSLLVLFCSMASPVTAAQAGASTIPPSHATVDPPLLDDCEWEVTTADEDLRPTTAIFILMPDGNYFWFNEGINDEGEYVIAGYGTAWYHSSEDWDFDVFNDLTGSTTTYRWNGTDQYVRDPFGNSPTKYMTPK